MIDQAVYALLDTVLGSGVVNGHVLNVGLGPGRSARLCLQSRLVDAVDSIEIDSKVIDDYKATYQDDLEKIHTVVLGDIRSDTLPNTYDCVFLDIEFETADCKLALENIFLYMNEGAVVITETLPRENQMMSSWTNQKSKDPDSVFWEWMNQTWEPIEARPALTAAGRAQAASMRYLMKVPTQVMEK